jgi:hypothetical protein
MRLNTRDEPRYTPKKKVFYVPNGYERTIKSTKAVPNLLECRTNRDLVLIFSIIDSTVTSVPGKEHLDGRTRGWVRLRDDFFDRPTCPQGFEVVKNRTASEVLAWCAGDVDGSPLVIFASRRDFDAFGVPPIHNMRVRYCYPQILEVWPVSEGCEDVGRA